MLIKLEIKNCFTHTDTVVDFKRGLGVISGKNEAGKSLIIEMIEFALFGAAALRGVSTDYRSDFSVALELEISGTHYRIERSLRKAELQRLGQIEVTGVRPVNAEIRRLLGFDLQVFRTVVHIRQHDSVRLTGMAPAARKAMIDATLGMDALDRADDHLTKLRAEQRATVKAIRDVLGEEPQKPDMPEVEDDRAEELQQALMERIRLEQHVETLAQRFERLVDLAAQPEPEAPTEPCPESLEQLKAAAAEHTAAKDKIHQLEVKLAGIPVFDGDIAFIKRCHGMTKRWEEHQRQRPARECNDKPSVPEDQIEPMTQAWEAYHAWKRHEMGQTECPECGHHFDPSDPSSHVEEAAEPSVSEEDLKKAAVVWPWYTAWQAWVAATPSKPERMVTDSELEAAKAARDRQDERNMLAGEIEDIKDTLPRLKRMADLLPKMEQYLVDRDRYATAHKQWEQYAHDCEVAQGDLATARIELRDSLTSEELRADIQATAQAQHSWKLYRDRLEKYNETGQRLASAEDRLEDLEAAKAALQEVRQQVKTHIIPAISTIASALLTRMTGGERSQVQITDGFEISSNGSRLETLSGAAQVVVNLAVRLALRQILAGHKLDFFMGDEIDASMDAERADFTQEAMSNVATEVGQVVLISHKDLQGDWGVQL